MPLPLFLAFAISFRQDTYLRNPEHLWAFRSIDLMRREGIVVGYPNTFYRRDARSSSRFEMAVVFQAAATNQLERAQAFVASPQSDIERASLLRSAVFLPVYKRAGKEFRTELTALGVEGDFGQSRLAVLTRKIEATAPERARLFRDVPVDHWAAKAVGDLRALGLLDGYAGGDLRG